MKNILKRWKDLQRQESEWKKLKAEDIWQEAVAVAAGEMVLVCIVWLCYGDYRFIGVIQILMPLYLREVHQWRKEQEHKQFDRGFGELMQSMTASLQAGLSLENACREAAWEACIQYRKKGGYHRAMKQLIHGLDLHIPPEVLFREMADRAESEEIRQFATVLEIIRVSGGNAVEVLRESMDHLKRKLDTEEEIAVTLSGKLLEKNLMLLMPFVILLYLRIMSPEYIACFYTSAAGHVMMSVMLTVVTGCYYWTKKIMDIGF